MELAGRGDAAIASRSKASRSGRRKGFHLRCRCGGWAALSSGAATFPELDTLVIELLCSPHLAARKFTIIAQSGELRIKLLGGIARISWPQILRGGFLDS